MASLEEDSLPAVICCNNVIGAQNMPIDFQLHCVNRTGN